MLRNIFVIFVFVLFIRYGKFYEIDFKQEHAKVEYFNPKYVEELTILTHRDGRKSPYLTSANFTTLVPFGNNVTWRIEISSSKLITLPLRIDFDCDRIRKMTWLMEWLKSGSDIPTNQCPLPVGHYHLRKVAFPPKNFPIQLSNVDYFGKLYMFVTSTKERVVEASIIMKSH